jgi:Na+/H+ antiporter NhaD/arsenite permease-like protein
VEKTLSSRIADRLRREPLFVILMMSFPLLWALVPTSPPELAALIDVRTLAALAGLMVLSRGLEDSGYLSAVARLIISRIRTERALAMALVVFSAALSAIITNDVALFIVVPLTLGLGRMTTLPVGRLVIFQALAVNAGSALSPVGNPQNLYLWQHSGVSVPEFLLGMLPLTTGLMASLLVATSFAFRSRPLARPDGQAMPVLHRRLFWISLGLYVPFLVAADFGYAVYGMLAIIAVYILLARRVLAGVDWFLLAIFLFMFLDTGLLARHPFVANLSTELLNAPGGVLTVGIVLSQLISNVPAALFLNAFTDDWLGLAWAVTVGGFGLAIGSLANLIALRLAREPGLFVRFHLYSIPMLFAAWAIAWLLS